MTVFLEMVVESILPNQIKWSWYHFFQKTVFCLMKSKYAIFSNTKVTNIERSSFLEHPIYEKEMKHWEASSVLILICKDSNTSFAYPAYWS